MVKYSSNNYFQSVVSYFKISMLSILALSSVVLAENSMRDDLREVELSPLFQQKFLSSQISAKGLNTITLHNGIKLELKKYINLTRLDRNVKLAPLMKPKMFSKYLHSKPTYKENILQLNDRLIIDRVMKISMQKGVCKQRNLPNAVKELCFTSKKGKIPQETREYLRSLRKKLNKSKGNKMVKGGMRANQLKNMNDNDLLDLMLNSDDREVSLISVLPTKIYSKNTNLNLWNSKTKLPISNLKLNPNLPALSQFNTKTPPKKRSGKMQRKPAVKGSGKMQQKPAVKGSGKMQQRVDKVFPKNYFLTGFTFGRSISDKYELHIAKETFFTDRYYIRLSYFFSAGLGMRFPFSVDLVSKPMIQSGTIISRSEINVSVNAIDVDREGMPAYPKVGLPRNKYFKGKEFVLELEARCHFKASIPGKDINVNCGRLKKDYSRHINPVLGNQRSTLGELWVKGSDVGLGVDVWAGSASIDFGVQANVKNGKIGFKARGLNGTLIDNNSSKSFSFNNNRVTKFYVSNNNKNSEFKLDTPTYGFNIEIVPRVRAKLNLDLGIKEFHRTLGPYSIDALSVSLFGFSLDRHEGTVSKHNYRL